MSQIQTHSSGETSASKNPMNEDLNFFLDIVENYKPTIPEALTKYYAEKSGMSVTDTRILKLLSLAADKYLASTIYEAKEQALLKAKNPKNKRKIPATGVDTIDMFDLEGSLAHSNVFWRRSSRKKISRGNGNKESDV